MDSMMTELFRWLSLQAYLAAGGDTGAQVIVWLTKGIMWGLFVLFLLTAAMWIALPWAIRAQRKQRRQLLKEQQIANLYLNQIDEKLGTMAKNSITLISRRKDD